MISIGLAGKPNTGKSTFFNAATLGSAEVAPYPFTTKDANYGICYVRVKCVCTELGLKGCECEKYVKGERFVPAELIDVAGLVPDAHKGRGLGNEFLDNLRRADVIINVVDASGATDPEGNIVSPGSYDCTDDVRFFEYEFTMWLYGIISRRWVQNVKRAMAEGGRVEKVLAEQLAGIGIKEDIIREALPSLGSNLEKVEDEKLIKFADFLRRRSKPMVIAANKVDLATRQSVESLRKFGYPVIPCSAEAELILRSACKLGLIRYVPGDSTFEIVGNLNERQLSALEKVRKLLSEWGSTGVQQCINHAVLDLLRYVVVYPVEDENKFCASDGRILPDAFLMPPSSTPRDLAFSIHSDLGEGFLYAVDARTKRRLGEKYILRNGDVIKIVSAK